MKRWITKGLVLCSIALAPAVNSPAEPLTAGQARDRERRQLGLSRSRGSSQVTEEPRYTKDSRFRRIKAFFNKRQCPMEKYANDLVAAADRHQLDWRLLPSLALVESSGGKAYMNNNVFGWDSCKRKFPSIQAGIHVVAERLANSPTYRGKSLEGKLYAYNQNPGYAAVVKRVMSQMATETW